MGTSLRELIANAEKAGVSLKQLRGYDERDRNKGATMIKAIQEVQKAFPEYQATQNKLTPGSIDEFYKAVGQ